MGTFLTETAVRKTFLDRMDEGEKLQAVARGTDLLGKPVYAGKTDRRGLILRLSRSYEVKEEESVPLGRLDKKLKRMALVKGTYLAPPGEPAFSSDKLHAVYDAERETLKGLLEPGEELMTVGMAREPGLGDKDYFYVAFTNQRVILARLRGRREVSQVEGVALADLESFEMRNGNDPVPIDIPVFQGQEERLFFSFADGLERRLLVTDLFGHRREDAPD